MAININEQRVGGRVGRDAELRPTKSGSHVCNFSIATHFPKGKEKELETTWHDCVGFGEFWVHIAPRIKKGIEIYVEGRTEDRKFKGKDGADRSARSIVVNKCYLIQDTKTPRTDADLQSAHDAPSDGSWNI